MRSGKVPEEAYKQRPAYHVLEDPVGHFSRELEPVLFLEHWRSSILSPDWFRRMIDGTPIDLPNGPKNRLRSET
jgi:hypothetical protein